MKTKSRSGFTLIEVLIVVVIMAVLAATIVPQFTNSANDARESSAKLNLHSLRGVIEMYKLHHAGANPSDLTKITSATNEAGVIGAAGASYPYGPYIQNEIPANPFTGNNAVKVDSTTGAPTADANGGWIYRPGTGEIFINHPDYLDE